MYSLQKSTITVVALVNYLQRYLKISSVNKFIRIITALLESELALLFKVYTCHIKLISSTETFIPCLSLKTQKDVQSNTKLQKRRNTA